MHLWWLWFRALSRFEHWNQRGNPSLFLTFWRLRQLCIKLLKSPESLLVILFFLITIHLINVVVRNLIPESSCQELTFLGLCCCFRWLILTHAVVSLRLRTALELLLWRLLPDSLDHAYQLLIQPFEVFAVIGVLEQLLVVAEHYIPLQKFWKLLAI